MSDIETLPGAFLRGEPHLWRNPNRTGAGGQASAECDITLEDIRAADARLRRFAPYLARTFAGPWHRGPDGQVQEGVIDSALQPLPRLQRALDLANPLWLKRDDALPISGSIKARGGIYEVLATAERILSEAGLLPEDAQAYDPSLFKTAQVRRVLGRWSIAVGSTGNLGLSIGTMARAMGFRAVVHMSADAREWKKRRLRSLGAQVLEYEGDYALAVQTGRERAQSDLQTHFVDDENSRDLFLGYAVAGLRLGAQLDAAGIGPDADHPLHVYLPCGVGGGPGGVIHGIRLALGERAEHVHCWYAEPTAACAMLLALATDRGARISVQDVGLDGRTVADGLAVGRASQLAWAATKRAVAGAYTVTDTALMELLALLNRTEGIAMEPSALAGLAGPGALVAAGIELPAGANHLAWGTGGSMVPPEEMAAYLAA
ncbi:D-serine ammonia-lyase [Gephyromycinifex aptenodytis]|uniref:D-serine ammonia-lyase n=1 Tax=Gephyromycinifex aptenodytis TaxID=2716227 RepID=UPI0014464B04|nr:D-serine ammonia-lyase [Gephyromycinifex aptenodytis]